MPSGATNYAMAGKGDIEALFRSSSKEIYSYMLRMFRDGQLAEDLTQETFVRALASIAGFKGTVQLKNLVVRDRAACRSRSDAQAA